MTETGQEKPLHATPKKLRDARKRGDVARSTEFTGAAVMAAYAIVGLVEASWFMRSAADFLREDLLAATRPSIAAMLQLLSAAARLTTGLIIGLVGPVAVIALVATFLQVGPVFSLEPLAPKATRLNPINGLLKAFSAEKIAALIRSILKAGVLVPIVTWLVLDEAAGAPSWAAATPSEILQTLARGLLRFAGAAAFVAVAAGAGDLLYQRIAYAKRQRMSVQERRRERKQQHGEPRMKRERRRLHRQWANQRAGAAARDATVVVVNPTHLAIALDYDPREHAAPVVTAKGQDHVAMEMKREAEDAGVPIAHNITLARALYERTETEDIVPEDLFNAVAEVIVWARTIPRRPEAAEAAAWARP